MDVYLTKAPPHTQKTLCHTEDTCLQQPVQVQQSSVVTAAESLQTEAHKKKGSWRDRQVRSLTPGHKVCNRVLCKPKWMPTHPCIHTSHPWAFHESIWTGTSYKCRHVWHQYPNAVVHKLVDEMRNYSNSKVWTGPLQIWPVSGHYWPICPVKYWIHTHERGPAKSAWRKLPYTDLSPLQQTGNPISLDIGCKTLWRGLIIIAICKCKPAVEEAMASQTIDQIYLENFCTHLLGYRSGNSNAAKSSRKQWSDKKPTIFGSPIRVPRNIALMGFFLCNASIPAANSARTTSISSGYLYFQRSSNHQSIPHSGIVHYLFVPSGCFKNLSSKKLLLHMHFHIATKCNYSQWWSLQGKGINLWKCIWMLKVDSPYAVLQGCISIPSRCQCCIACPQQMQEHLL